MVSKYGRGAVIAVALVGVSFLGADFVNSASASGERRSTSYYKDISRFGDRFAGRDILSVSKASEDTELGTASKSPQRGPKSQKSSLIFSDDFTGPDELITNGYAHFNDDDCAKDSPDWDVTSGTLLRQNNTGYSGKPTRETRSVCDSTEATHSAIFRMTAEGVNVGKADVTFDYNLVSRGEYQNSYDGLHLWLGHQSERALYAVSLARWDGTITIKKKVPSDEIECAQTSNDGCYFNLHTKVSRPDLVTPGTWRNARAVMNTSANGNVTIDLYIDGEKIVTAVDDGTYGRTYTSGTIGIRGDNTEFFVDNVKVSAVR